MKPSTVTKPEPPRLLSIGEERFGRLNWFMEPLDKNGKPIPPKKTGKGLLRSVRRLTNR